MPAGDVFVRQVRDALENLHDLPHLQAHPLAALAGASAPSGRALQRALEEVLSSRAPPVHGAKPAASPGSRPRARR